MFKADKNDSIPKPTSQKALSSIFNHRKWVRLLDAAHEFDRTAVDTTLDHREATRIVSASQFASGSWLEVPPDASLPYARPRSGGPGYPHLGGIPLGRQR